MNIHFIAIGGSAMHNLAIALHKKGYHVSGSDDEVFEPSRSRLAKYDLLPKKFGWFPENITQNLDAIILGMHARIDNPELLKAQEMGLKIYSYPEYLYEQTKDKFRVVIGGSHGKTTTTSMVMHVLNDNDISFDYMVGANIEGFETMVHLSNESKIAIFEGDEYLSSPIDRRPKFHLYKPNLALITGIAWDHINVFPTFENYVEQFKIFANLIEPNGCLVYFEGDNLVKEVSDTVLPTVETIPYTTPLYKIEENKIKLKYNNQNIELNIFGEHNLQNLAGAKIICNKLGLTDSQFFDSISSFKGAAKRLQKLKEKKDTTLFLDFAHSPSKLKATVEAVKQQFENRKIIACMELHTFSSLKKEFLPQYKDTMLKADLAYVYFNPETIKHKKLEEITKEMVKTAFGSSNVQVYNNSQELITKIKSINLENTCLLFMTSGNFSGVDLKEFANELV